MEVKDKTWEYHDNEVVDRFNEISRSIIENEIIVELEDVIDSTTIHELTETAYFKINKENDETVLVSEGGWSNKNNN